MLNTPIQRSGSFVKVRSHKRRRKHTDDNGWKADLIRKYKLITDESAISHLLCCRCWLNIIGPYERQGHWIRLLRKFSLLTPPWRQSGTKKLDYAPLSYYLYIKKINLKIVEDGPWARPINTRAVCRLGIVAKRNWILKPFQLFSVIEFRVSCGSAPDAIRRAPFCFCWQVMDV